MHIKNLTLTLFSFLALLGICLQAVPSSSGTPKPILPIQPRLKVQLLVDTNGNTQLQTLLTQAFYDIASKDFPFLQFVEETQPYTLYILASHHNETLGISSILYKRQNLSVITSFLKASNNPMAGWLEKQELGSVVQRSLYLTPFTEGEIFTNVARKLEYYSEEEFQEYAHPK